MTTDVPIKVVMLHWLLASLSGVDIVEQEFARLCLV